MNWFVNLFKSKELVYVEQLYIETKKDKERLITENESLRTEIKELNNKVLELSKTSSNNSYTDVIVKHVKKPVSNKLSPREQEIYDLYLNSMNYDDVFKKSKMKPATFEVYLSRIRKRGYELKWI